MMAERRRAKTSILLLPRHCPAAQLTELTTVSSVNFSYELSRRSGTSIKSQRGKEKGQKYDPSCTTYLVMCDLSWEIMRKQYILQKFNFVYVCCAK